MTNGTDKTQEPSPMLGVDIDAMNERFWAEHTGDWRPRWMQGQTKKERKK